MGIVINLGIFCGFSLEKDFASTPQRQLGQFVQMIRNAIRLVFANKRNPAEAFWVIWGRRAYHIKIKP
jgi:hypothetical protein